MKSGLAHHVRDVEVGSSNLLTPTSLAEVPQQWGDDELSFLGYFLPVSFFERASSGQAPTSLFRASIVGASPDSLNQIVTIFLIAPYATQPF